VQCLSYHCKFNLENVPAESNHTLELTFRLAKDVTREEFEEIVLEYWPNENLDKLNSNEHITKVTVRLDQFDTEAIHIDDPNAET